MYGLTVHSVVRRRLEVLGNALSDRETVMLDLDKGRYFGVQDVGHEIWSKLERAVSVDELCTTLAQEYEIDLDTCTTEVLAFLEHLLQQGLIDEVQDTESVG